jgi:hypothetical protein
MGSELAFMNNTTTWYVAGKLRSNSWQAHFILCQEFQKIKDDFSHRISEQ